MKRKASKGKKGGFRPGSGRPPGSGKPTEKLMRTLVAEAYALGIEDIRADADREERKCNPVTEAYLTAYAEDHPDRVVPRPGNTIRETVKVLDEADFSKYRNAQKQLRKMGKPSGQGCFKEFQVAVLCSFVADLTAVLQERGLLKRPTEVLEAAKQMWPKSARALEQEYRRKHG
jgi:hypothetical protein